MNRRRGRLKITRSEIDVLRCLIRNSCTVIAFLIAAIATAEEPRATTESLFSTRSLVCPDVLLRGCCCIYCPKPLPCVRCLCCCCPDDYCCKPCPCVRCYQGGVCDCYCPKPCPVLCRPIAADYYTCEAGAFCGVCVPAYQVGQPSSIDGIAPSARHPTQPSPPESVADQSQLTQ